jgi:hypothetical protein
LTMSTGSRESGQVRRISISLPHIGSLSQIVNRLPDIMEITDCGPGTSYEYHIPSRLPVAHSDGLSEHPLHAIANNGVPHALADGEADSAVFVATGEGPHDQQPIGPRLALIMHSDEVAIASKAFFPSHSYSAGKKPPETILDRQSVTARQSPRLQYVSPPPSPHADSEPVYSLPVQSLRLICSLRHLRTVSRAYDTLFSSMKSRRRRVGQCA